jgi:hypothetical protein
MGTTEAVIEEALVEEETDEQVLARQKDEEAAFQSGFTGTAPTPTETPAEQAVVEPAKEDTPPAAESQPAAITDAQFKELLAKVGTVDELKGGLEKLRGDFFGKAGGLERTLKQLQESTPVGQPIEVKPEDLAELEAEFPGLNLGPSLAKGLTRVLGKLKGTGPTQAGLTPDEIDAKIAAQSKAATEAAIAEDRKRQAAERLTDLHEDWQTVIGPPDSQTEFRTWLKGQGPEKEQAFLSSWDPRYVAKTLTTFKETKRVAPKPSPKPAANTRTQRLAEAVPAKGGALPVPKSKINEEEEAFAEGFKNR